MGLSCYGHVCFHPLVKVVSSRSPHCKMTIFAFVDEKVIWGKILASVSSCSVPGGTEYHGLRSRHREPIGNID